MSPALRGLLAGLGAALALAAGAGALEYHCPDGTVCETYVGCPCLHKCPNGAPVTDPRLCPDASGPGATAARCPTEYRIASGGFLCTQREDVAAWAAADVEGRAALRAPKRCFELEGAPVSLSGPLAAEPDAPTQVKLYIESGEAEPGFTLRRFVEKCE